jgi:hypothetical protein
MIPRKLPEELKVAIWETAYTIHSRLLGTMRMMPPIAVMLGVV